MNFTRPTTEFLSACALAANEYRTGLFGARLLVAIWERAGGAKSKDLKADLRQESLVFVVDQLCELKDRGLADPARGTWFLTTRGTELVGEVFKHLAEFKAIRREAA